MALPTGEKVFFKKNQLALAHSRMVGYFDEPCINCQDNSGQLTINSCQLSTVNMINQELDSDRF
jgi:hypothetical protein